MIEFCEACGASLTEGVATCEECGRTVARKRRTAPVSRGRTRRATSTKRGATWIPWAVAGGLLAVTVVLFFALGGTDVVDGGNEPEQPPGESAALVALREEREAKLVQRVAGFHAAWNGGDAAAVGAYYPPRHAARARRLPDRLADRGWADELPAISEPLMGKHRDGEFARHADFFAGEHEVRTVWKFESGEWYVVQLILPEVVSADPPMWNTAIGLGGSERTSAVDWTRPFARAEVATAQALADLPAMSEIVDAVFAQLDDESLEDDVRGNWERIEWPVDFQLHVGDYGFAGILRTANDAPFVLRSMGEAAARDLPDGSVPPELPAVRVDALGFAALPLGGATLFEGVVDGRCWLVVAPGATHTARTHLERAVRGREEPIEVADALWQRTAGGAVRLAAGLESLLPFAGGNDAAQLRAAVEMFAGDLSGLSIRGGKRGARYEFEVFVDLCAGAGLLGALLLEEPEPRLPLGWIPANAREFACGRIDIDALTRLLGSLSMFGISLDPAVLDEELAPLGENFVPAMLGHLDGAFGVLVVPSTPESALDPDAAEPAVFVLGAEDPASFRQELVERLTNLVDLDVLPAPSIGASVWGLALPGEGIGLYLAEGPGALLVAVADDVSAGLLRDALATGGRAPALPAAFRERIDSVPANASMVSLSSIVSDAAGRQAIRETPSRSLPFARDMLERVFASGGGVNATVLTVEGDDGIVLRAVY